MNKILLYNFPKRLSSINLYGLNDPNRLFGSEKDPKCFFIDSYFPNSGIANIRSDILSALILHDILCVAPYNILNLLHLLGTDNCIDLLESSAIEIYKDIGPELGPTVSATLHKADRYKLLNMHPKNYDILSVLEDRLYKLSSSPKSNLNKEKIKKILQLVICRTKPENEFLKSNILFKETGYDLNNKNITTLFNLVSPNVNAITKQELPLIMRMHYINKGIINAQTINCQSILIDAWAKSFLREKLSPALQSQSLGFSTDVFQKVVLPKKGIPDLNILFARGIINIRDILSFRETSHGKLFRAWIKTIEYDPDSVLESLLSKKSPSLKRRVFGLTRWVYPIICGLINPIAGPAASYIDSYIVQKILEGWHPSLFLDDQFKLKIDNKIKQMDKNNLKANLAKVGIKIGRNDHCPCGSRKKFKKCCGKI